MTKNSIVLMLITFGLKNDGFSSAGCICVCISYHLLLASKAKAQFCFNLITLIIKQYLLVIAALANSTPNYFGNLFFKSEDQTNKLSNSINDMIITCQFTAKISQQALWQPLSNSVTYDKIVYSSIKTQFFSPQFFIISLGV